MADVGSPKAILTESQLEGLLSNQGIQKSEVERLFVTLEEPDSALHAHPDFAASNVPPAIKMQSDLAIQVVLILLLLVVVMFYAFQLFAIVELQ